ncbi:MAG: hypothetical protein RSD40_00370 [Bacilli bacterium]
MGIGTTEPHPSSALDVSATNKGLRLPLITLTSIDDQTTVNPPVKGFIAYNMSDAGTGANAVTKGIYTFDGERWNKVLSRKTTSNIILEIPFLIPIFVASNIVADTETPVERSAGATTVLTFDKLDYNAQNGVTGIAPDYTGYTIQEDGIYSISFAVDVRNASGDADGEQIFFVKKNGTTVCDYGMQRKFQFGGISNNCTELFAQGDDITFEVRSTGSSYRIYNTNVAIYQSH